MPAHTMSSQLYFMHARTMAYPVIFHACTHYGPVSCISCKRTVWPIVLYFMFPEALAHSVIFYARTLFGPFSYILTHCEVDPFVFIMYLSAIVYFALVDRLYMKSVKPI